MNKSKGGERRRGSEVQLERRHSRSTGYDPLARDELDTVSKSQRRR